MSERFVAIGWTANVRGVLLSRSTRGLRAKNCTPGTHAIENSDLSGTKLDNVHAPDVEISNSTLGDFAVDSSNLDRMLISGATDATNATITRTSLRDAHLLDLRLNGQPGTFAYNRVSGAGLPGGISIEDLATLEFDPTEPPCLRSSEYEIDTVLELANFADTTEAQISESCSAYPSV